MRTFAKIIGYGLVVVILAVFVGVTYKYTNGFNEDFKTFYIAYNGNQILTTENKMTFKKEAVHRFDVKYTFDKNGDKPKGYKVKIVSNMTRDFDYTVDGENYLFSKLGDLTTAFEPIMYDTFFELYFPESLSFSGILKKAHNGKSVSVSDDALINNPYPFKLQVSSYNDKVTYNIEFTFPQEREYQIGYIISGDGTNLTNLSIDGPRSAAAGETITFNVIIYDKNYVITGCYVYAFGVQRKPEIITVNGGYQFIMPSCGVDIRIDLEYISPTPNVPHCLLECDSLGWGNLSMVDINCPDRAAIGETVTFTANIKSEYASEYKISSISILFSSGNSYIEDFQPVNGVYSFTVPGNAIMEDGNYLTLLFYIVPIDM